MNLNELRTNKRPWLHLLDDSIDLEPLTSALGVGGSFIVQFDGSRMQDVDAAFREFARELQFPPYFGGNWPAFAECVMNLEWLPAKAYLLVIRNADALLADSKADRDTLLKLLNKAGSHWANSFALGAEWGGGEVPFNTLLVCKTEAVSSLRGAVEIYR